MTIIIDRLVSIRPLGIIPCALLLVLATGDSRGEAPQPAGPRPSLLLITLDTTRADHLGCYGAEFARTPNLDKLASSGVRFDRALSPTPLTLPSHASLMTGLVPRRHGVRDNARFSLDSGLLVLAERLRYKGYTTAAFVSSVVLDRRLGLAQGFDLYDDNVRVGERGAFNYEERAASQTTEAVLARLEEIPHPFFLWVHFFDPHLPYVPPEPFRSRFDGRPYDGEIAFMDHELGRLLSAVKKKAGGRLLIVAAGDHGESLGEHGEAAHGIFVYQSTQRVPLILSGPGVAAGKVVPSSVGLVDVAPTILDLLGLPPLEDTDGRSLAPMISGKKIPPADYEMESFFSFFAYGWAAPRALVQRSHKYVEAPRPELYDLAADPAESRNLLEKEKGMARSLAKALGRMIEGDEPAQPSVDADLAEQRHLLESLGYVGGTGGDGGKKVIDPKDAISWIGDLEAGRLALQQGKPEDGIAPLSRLLSRNPRNVPALLSLSLCHLRTGDADKAVALSRRAVAINPDDEITHFGLANALAGKGRSDPRARLEAHQEYEKTLALNPRHVDGYMNCASMLLKDGKAKEAEALLGRAVEAGVRDPDLEVERGLLAVARGDAVAAHTAFKRALILNPESQKALEGLGQTAYAAREFRDAADYYARALENAPSAGLARTLGSILLYELEDRDGARRAYRRALELSPPGDPDSEMLRELLQELEGDPQ